ncbi:SPOR domain-containing protein [Alkalilacustris brevis]|uniref:SPOR domain-containing protein n=1 Tax=Alkalilacustris brevis TaxID=2026338 RepID=UPI000E0D49BE|nr:SPOR domain-containing protein [Alkalilacustris brevis]
MTKAGIGRLALFGGILLALSACEDGEFALPFGGGDGAEGATAQDGAPGSVRMVERDVEAPEVFQVSDQGLWDGRPSLGGVWVAHPSATDPERVIIRNEANGSFVIGALFRRERELPGPPLQVSSDAAATLGMLAGQPAQLNVTALRREETPEEPPARPEAEGEAQQVAAAATAAIESTTLEAPGAGESAPQARPASAPADDAAPATAPAPSSLDRPYVQIGIFSVKSNAEGAGNMLRGEGMVPTLREEASQGATFWRVVVGPARNASERATLLEKVKALGFTDAYAVRR